MQGKRAALAGLTEPPVAGETDAPPTAEPLVPPSAETRDALWKLAGLERTGAELERLCEDPHPLARAIATSALARTESRGAHQRKDFPETDRNFDGMHAVVSDDNVPRFEQWT